MKYDVRGKGITERKMVCKRERVGGTRVRERERNRESQKHEGRTREKRVTEGKRDWEKERNECKSENEKGSGWEIKK